MRSKNLGGSIQLLKRSLAQNFDVAQSYGSWQCNNCGRHEELLMSPVAWEWVCVFFGDNELIDIVHSAHALFESAHNAHS